MSARALLKQRAALEQCLDVLLRMCPDYCMDAHAEQCTEAEHDAAIAAALTVFHGPNREYWPPVARAIVERSIEGPPR